MRVANHAIVAMLLMIDGEKVALLLSAPAVYEFKDGEPEGGSAENLAGQLVSSLKQLGLRDSALSGLVTHHADATVP